MLRGQGHFSFLQHSSFVSGLFPVLLILSFSCSLEDFEILLPFVLIRFGCFFFFPWTWVIFWVSLSVSCPSLFYVSHRQIWECLIYFSICHLWYKYIVSLCIWQFWFGYTSLVCRYFIDISVYKFWHIWQRCWNLCIQYKFLVLFASKAKDVLMMSRSVVKLLVYELFKSWNIPGVSKSEIHQSSAFFFFLGLVVNLGESAD